jgi:nucleoside-diphosphate-sugar epimerase
MNAVSRLGLATTFLVAGQPTDMADRFLVTGANGCIGAWVLHHLTRAGADVIAFDLQPDEHRHRLVNRGKLPEVEWRWGDLTNAEDVRKAATGATRIIHLAALQIPFCRANPAAGAAVNVLGTVHIFEAAKELGVLQVAQASSIAVYGAATDYDSVILPTGSKRNPTTLYGVYKVACEDLAKVYWAEHNIRSVCLRPHTVFGPGRDQGMTSLPSIAIEKAIARESYHITYGGRLDFQYASDVAKSFIDAANLTLDNAPVFDLAGAAIEVREFVEAIKLATGFSEITCGDSQLPVVAGASGSDWMSLPDVAQPTELSTAILESAELFKLAKS